MHICNTKLHVSIKSVSNNDCDLSWIGPLKNVVGMVSLVRRDNNAVLFM